MTGITIRGSKRRASLATQVVNWMTDYGWDRATAEYEVQNWIYYGLGGVTLTPKKAIRKALAYIRSKNAPRA